MHEGGIIIVFHWTVHVHVHVHTHTLLQPYWQLFALSYQGTHVYIGGLVPTPLSFRRLALSVFFYRLLGNVITAAIQVTVYNSSPYYVNIEVVSLSTD